MERCIPVVVNGPVVGRWASDDLLSSVPELLNFSYFPTFSFSETFPLSPGPIPIPPQIPNSKYQTGVYAGEHRVAKKKKNLNIVIAHKNACRTYNLANMKSKDVTT